MAEHIRRRWHREDGNTLALFPAAVLVMFVLTSIAVDAAVTFSAQRRVADMASGIANDAASALSDERYFTGGEIVIDPVQAQQRADAALARRGDADRYDVSCAVTTPGGDRVEVTCTGRVQQLISPMRFLGIGSRHLSASAAAVPVAG